VRDAVLLSRKVHDAADRILGSDHPVTTQLGLLLWDTLAAGKQVSGRGLQCTATSNMLGQRLKMTWYVTTPHSGAQVKE
jgi:hypothetical protein